MVLDQVAVQNPAMVSNSISKASNGIEGALHDLPLGALGPLRECAPQRLTPDLDFVPGTEHTTPESEFELRNDVGVSRFNHYAVLIRSLRDRSSNIILLLSLKTNGL